MKTEIKSILRGLLDLPLADQIIVCSSLDQQVHDLDIALEVSPNIVQEVTRLKLAEKTIRGMSALAHKAGGVVHTFVLSRRRLTGKHDHFGMAEIVVNAPSLLHLAHGANLITRPYDQRNWQVVADSQRKKELLMRGEPLGQAASRLGLA